MKIIFYTNLSDKKVINKNINKVYECECQLKNATSLIDPTLIVKNNNILTSCNYAYIPKFKRYYYLSANSINKDIVEFVGHVDVLMSNKSQLLKTEAIIGRQEFLYNLYLNDPNILTQFPVITEHINFDGTLDVNPHYVLNVAGGVYPSATPAVIDAEVAE